MQDPFACCAPFPADIWGPVYNEPWKYENGALWTQQAFPAFQHIGDIAGIFRYDEDLDCDYTTPGVLFLQYKYVIDGREYPNSLAFMEEDICERANCAICIHLITGRIGVVTTRPIQAGERLVYWN